VADRAVSAEVVFDRAAASSLALAYRILVPERRTRAKRSDQGHEEGATPPGSTNGICGGSITADGGVSDAAPPIRDAGPDAPQPVDAGVCALYGQLCDTSSPCCDGVPCNIGRCRFN